MIIELLIMKTEDNNDYEYDMIDKENNDNNDDNDKDDIDEKDCDNIGYRSK